MMDVTLLGTGGMMPLPNRYLTSLLTRVDGRMLLIDCGEGTQVTLKQTGFGYKNLDAICFTHYHADHVTGLPGLLLAVAATGREEPVTFFGPPGLKRVVESICVVARELPFPLRFCELPASGASELFVENTDYVLHALPLDHACTCFAYTVEFRRLGRFDVTRAEALGLPKPLWGKLQREETVEFEGKTYTSDMVLGPTRKGIKVSYCTDTRPVPGLPAFVSDADLFICEGMYGDPEKADNAARHKHMTYAEAAQIALAGNVKKLWLTHYSPAMTNPKEFLHVARDIFPNTTAGFDRISETIMFEED